MPDIGQIFPDNDPEWSGADSSVFMEEAFRRMESRWEKDGQFRARFFLCVVFYFVFCFVLFGLAWSSFFSFRYGFVVFSACRIVVLFAVCISSVIAVVCSYSTRSGTLVRSVYFWCGTIPCKKRVGDPRIT